MNSTYYTTVYIYRMYANNVKRPQMFISGLADAALALKVALALPATCSKSYTDRTIVSYM